MEELMQPFSRGDLPRREVMQTPDEVAAMLRLKGLGWGIKRIAKELGCSHMTVRHYVAQGGWLPYRGGRRRRALGGLEDWLAECFRRHAGNADVVRQELAAEKASSCVCARSSAKWHRCGASWRRKHGLRFASRRPRASSCRSTSASAGR